MEIVESTNKTKILLESGTNELNGQVFGINIANVIEILMAQVLYKMPHSHFAVEGVFKSRDEIISVIDLGQYLDIPSWKNHDQDIFIITHFNKLNFGFRVEKVIGIDRISWEHIKKPDSVIYGDEDGLATGIAEYNNRLITILDFERIVGEISPETSIKSQSLSKLGKRRDNEKPILIVEDSTLLSKLITDCLHKAGYINTIKLDNGQEAWNYLKEVKELGEPIEKHVACIVSDIEMPLMDGHRLTKLVKEDNKLREIPLILFSSLITDEIRVKGEELGADDQISKPEIVSLVEIIDRLI